MDISIEPVRGNFDVTDISFVVGLKRLKLDRALLPAQFATFLLIVGLAARVDHTSH